MDVVANALTKIRNGQKAKQAEVTVAGNKLLLNVCEILKNEGYIEEYHSNTKEKKNFIDITLKYDEREEPIISEIKRVSHSSRRVYAKSDKIPRVANGFATVIVSTSQGVLTGKEAKARKLGGEVICYVL